MQALTLALAHLANISAGKWRDNEGQTHCLGFFGRSDRKVSDALLSSCHGRFTAFQRFSMSQLCVTGFTLAVRRMLKSSGRPALISSPQ